MADRVTEDDLSPADPVGTSHNGGDTTGAQAPVSDERDAVETLAGDGEDEGIFEPTPPPVELTADDGSASIAEDEKIEPAAGSDYLDDDELWMKSSDEILHSDGTTVVAKQDEAVVSWDIYGLYDEQGKVRSKRSLRNNPPALVISDSNGGEATFVLTRDLSGVLARHFENTHRAYYGIRPRSEMSFKEKVLDARSGLRENMGKAIVIGGILLGLVVFGIFF